MPDEKIKSIKLSRKHSRKTLFFTTPRRARRKADPASATRKDSQKKHEKMG
jgi:hypothetical protein